MAHDEDDNVFERMNDPFRVPKGWVTYVANPMDPEKTVIVTCPLHQAPAWVQERHQNQDKEKP